jgi:hypothetical protein
MIFDTKKILKNFLGRHYFERFKCDSFLLTGHIKTEFIFILNGFQGFLIPHVIAQVLLASDSHQLPSLLSNKSNKSLFVFYATVFNGTRERRSTLPGHLCQEMKRSKWNASSLFIDTLILRGRYSKRICLFTKG